MKLVRARPPRAARLLPLGLTAAFLAAVILRTSQTSLWRSQPRRQQPRAAAAAGSDRHTPGEGGTGGGSAPAGTRTVCTDTCEGYARNGVCDEGRANSDAPLAQQPDGLTIFEVKCDLGSDCGDCGPWVHNNTAESDSWRPIADIRASKHRVFARAAMHPLRYVLAYTDPKKDLDVSGNLQHNGLFEPGYTWAWHNILKDGCTGPGGERRLVLDVGANFGYYTVLSAAMGCRVVAWEPVPLFSAFLRYALLRNGLTHAVQLREGIVTNSSGGRATVVVPNTGIWGTAGIDGANLDKALQNDGDYGRVTRTTERLDDVVVAEEALILKVDVEGFEPAVLRGAKRLLAEKRVAHLFMEYSPGVAEKWQDWRWFEEHPRALLGLLRDGYGVLHLAPVHGDWPDWSGARAMNKMEEVTEAQLLHDLEDAWRLQDGALGCIPAGLLDGLPPTGTSMFGCNAIPEGFDPRSFRASFGFNTNLYVHRGQRPSWVRVGRPASLVPPDFDTRQWFTGGGRGAAGRLCHDMAPQVQVAHRCRCTDAAVCGEQENRVSELAAAGKLPPLPLEGRSLPADLGIDSW